MECGKTYNVRAAKQEYTTKEQKINIAYKNGRTNLPIALEKSTCKVAVGDDLGKCFGIKMIYFDFDKSDIRQEAALDLEKILDVLNQYPAMKLDIRSHTDSRGTFKYNEAVQNSHDEKGKEVNKRYKSLGAAGKRLKYISQDECQKPAVQGSIIYARNYDDGKGNVERSRIREKKVPWHCLHQNQKEANSQ